MSRSRGCSVEYREELFPRGGHDVLAGVVGRHLQIGASRHAAQQTAHAAATDGSRAALLVLGLAASRVHAVAVIIASAATVATAVAAAVIGSGVTTIAGGTSVGVRMVLLLLAIVSP